MTDQTFNNLYCSTECDGFIILYDALGSYRLFYEDEFLVEINEPLNPKELHKQHFKDLLVPFDKFKNSENKYPIFETIFNQITDILEEVVKNNRTIMRIFTELIRTVKDAYIDPNYNFDFFSNAPQYIIDVAKEISLNAGGDVTAFDKLITPTNIEEEIQQRVKPVLTTEEKTKADAIAEQINKMGLLPYLDNILDNIQIGKHKNIYRKILAVFNTMRGKGSYYNKSVAKFEAGKSFEDDLVIKVITPQRYIFKANRMSYASFLRFALRHERYFDRMILYFGDLGEREAYDMAKPILAVVKPLITDKEYTDFVSEKENDTGIIPRPLIVDSIQAVFQTVDNKTDDNGQLISRTLYFTPAIVEDKEVMTLNFYQRFSKSIQTQNKEQAKADLKDFGLYLMQMVNYNEEIVNPYLDVFLEYALKSESPRREFDHQCELFEAYCILTQEKCITNYSGIKWASLEQLKEYMDFINLENALIPYEFDFLEMIKADGKANEITILYQENDFYDADGVRIKYDYLLQNPNTDIYDADGKLLDIDLTKIVTLTECENTVIELMNNQSKQKRKIKLKANGYDDEDIENVLNDYEPIKTITDIKPKDIKEIPQKLMAAYGLRTNGANHSGKRIFFRISDLKNTYSKYNAYKNIDNVGQLLQTLHNKGYLGKYEYKQGKENLYYLTPLCETLKSKFKPAKSFDDYAEEFIANTGGYFNI